MTPLRSKYHDDKTGLVYYGYRYYSADLGRWINRDPIGERGGINLYGFVNNNSINALDNYGLTSQLTFSGSWAVYGVSVGNVKDKCCYKNRLVKRTLAKNSWHIGLTLNYKLDLPTIFKKGNVKINNSDSLGHCDVEVGKDFIIENDNRYGGNLFVFGVDSGSGFSWTLGLGGYYKLYEYNQYTVISIEEEKGCCEENKDQDDENHFVDTDQLDKDFEETFKKLDALIESMAEDEKLRNRINE